MRLLEKRYLYSGLVIQTLQNEGLNENSLELYNPLPFLKYGSSKFVGIAKQTIKNDAK